MQVKRALTIQLEGREESLRRERLGGGGDEK